MLNRTFHPSGTRIILFFYKMCSNSTIVILYSMDASNKISINGCLSISIAREYEIAIVLICFLCVVHFGTGEFNTTLRVYISNGDFAWFQFFFRSHSLSPFLSSSIRMLIALTSSARWKKFMNFCSVFRPRWRKAFGSIKWIYKQN